MPHILNQLSIMTSYPAYASCLSCLPIFCHVMRDMAQDRKAWRAICMMVSRLWRINLHQADYMVQCQIPQCHLTLVSVDDHFFWKDDHTRHQRFDDHLTQQLTGHFIHGNYPCWRIVWSLIEWVGSRYVCLSDLFRCGGLVNLPGVIYFILHID